MATTVDVLQYTLGMDIKNLRANARQAEKSVGDMSNRIGKYMGQIGAMFAGAFAATAVISQIKAMGAAITDYAKAATLTAARNEELQIVMENVGKVSGYSAEYLAQQEKTIASLGITTRNTRDMLIRLMQAQIDLSYATKLARVAQDLAVISGQNTAEAVGDLTNAIAAQRPMLLRQFGIVMNLGDIYSKQAKIIRKSAEELTEYEKRMAFVNVILEQGARVTGTYEAAMTTAGKQLRSLPRYFEELSATIGTIFLPMVAKMTEDVTAGVKKITGDLQENEEAIKKWQSNMLLAYAPIKFTFGFMVETTDKLLVNIRLLKGAFLDLPVAIFKRLAGLPSDLKKIKEEVGDVFGPPKPPAGAGKKTLKELSAAELDHMLWKLELNRKYEKITLSQFRIHLQQIISAYELNAEQKETIDRAIANVSYEIEKEKIDAIKDLQKEWLEWAKNAIAEEAEEHKNAVEEVKNYVFAVGDQKLAKETEEYETRKALLEEWRAVNEEVIDALLVGYDTFWNTILDMDMTGAERKKAIFESMAQAIIGLIADQAKEEIKLALGVAAVKEGAKKSELRTFMVTSAKTMAVMAKEAAMALASAAKWIYQAVAKIFSAHAGIPFVGVAIAGALVGAMMATIGKFKGFAEGGLVEGLLAGQDQLLAALTKGEYVMPKPAVARIGVPALEHMRRTGEVPGGNVTVNMGGFTFAGTKKSDAFLIEDFVTKRVSDAVKDALESRELTL